MSPQLVHCPQQLSVLAGAPEGERGGREGGREATMRPLQLHCPQAGLSRHQLPLSPRPQTMAGLSPASPLFPPLAHCPSLPQPSANPVVRRRRGAALCAGQVRGRAGTGAWTTANCEPGALRGRSQQSFLWGKLHEDQWWAGARTGRDHCPL